MKTKKSKENNRKDRIDALVDNLDRYYFRIAAATNILGGSEYLRGEDFEENVRDLFRTPRSREACDRFYENAKEAETKIPGMMEALESAAIDWQNAEEDFSLLCGYVLGLRVAGIPSDQTKKMARTWRIGLPQDDPQ